jgi:hypothetical protein
MLGVGNAAPKSRNWAPGVGQKEAFTKGRFEDISFAYACAIEWRHSALPQAQLSLCGRKC